MKARLRRLIPLQRLLQAPAPRLLLRALPLPRLVQGRGHEVVPGLAGVLVRFVGGGVVRGGVVCWLG